MLPLGERPLLVRVGVHYKFSKLVVDRVEAVDSTYDVLFIGTGCLRLAFLESVVIRISLTPMRLVPQTRVSF